MRLEFPFSGIFSAATAHTFGAWGFAAVVVCLIAWLLHSRMQIRARLYEKEVEAFPKLMERRLRHRHRHRRTR